MRARFVNEIKQDKEISGLGAINLGKASMFFGYSKMIELYPGIEEFEKPLVEFEPFLMSPGNFGDDHGYHILPDVEVKLTDMEMEEISRISGIPINELVYINPDEYSEELFLHELSHDALEELITYINGGENIYSGFVELDNDDEARWFDFNKTQAKFYFYWSKFANMGIISVGEEGHYAFIIYRKH